MEKTEINDESYKGLIADAVAKWLATTDDGLERPSVENGSSVIAADRVFDELARYAKACGAGLNESGNTLIDEICRRCECRDSVLRISDVQRVRKDIEAGYEISLVTEVFNNLLDNVHNDEAYDNASIETAMKALKDKSASKEDIEKKIGLATEYLAALDKMEGLDMNISDAKEELSTREGMSESERKYFKSEIDGWEKEQDKTNDKINGMKAEVDKVFSGFSTENNFDLDKIEK
jgi:hypothetical protein